PLHQHAAATDDRAFSPDRHEPAWMTGTGHGAPAVLCEHQVLVHQDFGVSGHGDGAPLVLPTDRDDLWRNGEDVARLRPGTGQQFAVAAAHLDPPAVLADQSVDRLRRRAFPETSLRLIYRHGLLGLALRCLGGSCLGEVGGAMTRRRRLRGWNILVHDDLLIVSRRFGRTRPAWTDEACGGRTP